MAGDYSRVSFDPRKRFAAVLMQQGRVQLDADWNEQAAILHERIRVQARDTFGRAAASRFGTEDAFKIGIIPGPPRDLSIAPGRYWVNGRVAEAFTTDGDPITYLKQPFLPAPPPLPGQGGAIVYLETWEREVTWVEDPSLLDVALGGVDTAARLQSVWQVRVLAQANAACGFDLDAIFPRSPARLTTAAVAPPAPEDPCLIAPKTGYRGLENRLYRVEVHTGGNAATARFKWSRDNASVRSPVLSLRKEMRGPKEVTVLSVARIGRDPGLRISAGDWVEITDEHRFLNGEPGEMAQVAEPPLEQPGEDGVQVVLDRVVPAAGTRAFGADAAQLAARRTRIIRWDQAAPRNVLDANGLMTVGTAAVGLEEGVEVTFTLAPANGQFRAGDWWVFRARTADASVEVLSAAPPRGPDRRYAQLAAFGEIGRQDSPSDCRTLWPPLTQAGGDGCCTVVVRPGEDVQKAIDSLGPAGGCVCLKAGVHELRDVLLIRSGRVSLHAEAPGAATLRRVGEVPILAVGGGAMAARVPVRDVHLAGIVFQLGSLADGKTDFEGLLSLAEDAQRVTVDSCRFQVQDFAGPAGGMRIAGGDIAVRDCVFERLPLGVGIVDRARDLSIMDCTFLADGTPEPDTDRGRMAIGAEECEGALRVERNTITGYMQGVVLGTDFGRGEGLRTTLVSVLGNLVLRSQPDESVTPQDRPGGLRPNPAAGRVTATRDAMTARETALSASFQPRFAIKPEVLDTKALLAKDGVNKTAGEAITTGGNVLDVLGDQKFLFAISVTASNATVAENVMTWRSPRYAGVLAGNGTRLVVGNDLVFRPATIVRDTLTGGAGNDQPSDRPALTLGIATGIGKGLGAAGCTVADNFALGPMVGITVAKAVSMTVQGNLLGANQAGILVASAEAPRITDNLLRGVETGITMLASAPVVDGNAVIDSKRYAIALIAGSASPPVGTVRITGNILRNCAYEMPNAMAVLASVADPAVEKDVAAVTGAEIVLEHNLIAEAGVDPGDPMQRAPRIVAATLSAPRVTVHGNDIVWDGPAAGDVGRKLLAEAGAKPHRALLVMPQPATAVLPRGETAAGAGVAITDNRIRGYAADTLIEVGELTGGANGQVRTRFLSVNFTGNAVEHWGPQDVPGAVAATVTLRADPRATVAVAGNTIRGPGRRPCVAADGPKEIAFAGNATTGPLIGAAGAVNVTV